MSDVFLKAISAIRQAKDEQKKLTEQQGDKGADVVNSTVLASVFVIDATTNTA